MSSRIALVALALAALELPSDAKPCEVSLATRIVRLPGGALRVRAVATNLTSAPIEVSAPDRCPNGPVEFAGLYQGYDYYRSCTKGACAGPRAPVRWTLPPGKPITLAEIEIDPKGAQCTRPLAKGRHQIGFTAPFATTVCGKRAAFEHPAKKCPAPPACDLYCPGSFARDANGCEICACEKSGLE